jgi:hypothetical protein
MQTETDIPPKIVNAIPLRAPLKGWEGEKVRAALDPEFFLASFAGVDLDDDAGAARFRIEHVDAADGRLRGAPVFHELRHDVIAAGLIVGTSP